MDPVQLVDLGRPKGRALLANRLIPADEVIFSESPLVCCQFSWNRFYGYKACDYCLQPLESAEENARRLLGKPDFCLPSYSGAPFTNPVTSVTCPSCGLGYCSEVCRVASEAEYHAFICPALCPSSGDVFARLEEEWRSSHHPPETGTIALLVRIAASHMAAHYKQDRRAARIVSALGRFVSSLTVDAPGCGDGTAAASKPTTLVHKMLGANFSGSISRLHACFLDALREMVRRAVGNDTPEAFMRALQACGLQAMLTEPGFCTAMCLIGRNGQGIGSSALGQWGTTVERTANTQSSEESEKFGLFLDSLYEQLDQTVGEFLDNEGVGLYEKQSLINHSCQPNACVRFQSGGNELQIVAKENIPALIEVTISYLDECMLTRGQHSRRKYLSEHYLFLCTCQRCLKEKQEEPESATSSEEEDDDEPGDEEMIELSRD